MVAVLPFGLLVAAALVRPLRLPILLLVVAGTALAARGRDRGPDRLRAAGPWAAGVPIAVSLCWGLLAAPVDPARASCTDPASPFALWRLGEATLALGAMALLAVVLGADGGGLGLRRPSRAVAALSVAGFLVAGPLALLVGPWLARPFFGTFGLASTTVGAIAPALAFAAANGVMEELEYRGAALSWSAPGLGLRGSLVAQAVVFGAAHQGPDFVGSAVPVALAMVAAGVVAGLIARRTGSLALPIAIHAGCDIPIYYFFACPVT